MYMRKSENHTEGKQDFPVYVVIPTHNRPDLLERTLSSVSNCVLPDNFERAIVVENGDPPVAEDLVADAPDRLQASYLYNEEANKSQALNLALDTVNKDSLVIFFDDDVRVRRNTLCAYVASAVWNHKSYFGGPCGIDYEEPPPAWLTGYMPRSACGWKDEPDGHEANNDFLGFNWAAFARHLKKAGGFQENIGPGTRKVGQESEMQQRLQNLGVRPCYVSEAFVWHYVPAQRCSPEWVIRRGQRQARTSAHELKSPVSGFRQYLRRLWWICHPRYFGWSLISCVWGTQKTKFRARYWGHVRDALLKEAGIRPKEDGDKSK